MAYTVRTLINKAYYLSGIVGKRFQRVSGEQENDGLDMLNAILSMKTAMQRLIPYYKEYEFDSITGQEMYFIPNLVLIESLTFNIGSVRYSMYSQGRVEYFGSARIDNIQSLPYSWHVERCKGGSNLYVYFSPDQNYPMKIWGKFSLADVTLGQDLSLILDQYYIEYLRYALAEYICQENNYSFQEESRKNLKEIENAIFDVSPLDLRMRKMSSLQKESSINYGDVNIGHGWRP